MKKLFTLVALLAVFLGAKAESWEQVFKVDHSTFQSFPYFVMGYVPEYGNGHLTDYGADYRYETQENLDNPDADGKWKDGESSVGTVMAGSTEYQKVTGAGPYWHQYFVADGIGIEIGATYKVVAKIKASEAASFNVNLGPWGGEKGVTINVPQADDFQEIEWQYEDMPADGQNCHLCAQPGVSTATIEWLDIVVYKKLKDGQKPKEWIEVLTNGDAETAWPAWALEKTDGVNINWRGDRAGEICAWALTMGTNNDSGEFNGAALDGRARPFPADIEEEEGNPSNHVFAVHVTQIDKIDDDGSVAWSNQFWIQSPQAWESGSKVKFKFRYKASVACSTGTQIHKQHPSDYLHWEAVGDVNFDTKWQDYEKEFTFQGSAANGWSLCFNLNSDATNGRTAPIDFYFDDLSWTYLKLDEGWFVAGVNAAAAGQYDFDSAIEFTQGADYLEATVGEKGKANTYVDQVAISTKRGDNSAFLNATIKPSGKIIDDPDEWVEYSTSANAKLDLPGLGVWKIYIDEAYNAVAFEMLEGTPYEQPDPVAIVTNTTEFVINATERDWRGTDNDGNPIEEQVGTGQPWDNQFWIAANRDLKKDEVTVLKFKYKSSIDAKVSTQAHKVGDDGKPCTYLNWQGIPEMSEFKAGDWVEYEQEWTIPAGNDGMRSIVFNLSEIKSACDYYIKDVQWYLKDASLDEGLTYENLIKAEGTENFWIKIDKSNPYQYGTDPSGINSVTTDVKNSSAAIYNLSGQRVSNEYKGIVVKSGKKYVVK